MSLPTFTDVLGVSTVELEKIVDIDDIKLRVWLRILLLPSFVDRFTIFVEVLENIFLLDSLQDL